MAASKTSPKAAARKAARPVTNKAQAQLSKLGATLAQIGAAAQVSRQACSKWMNGTSLPDTPARIAIAKRWPTVTPDLWDISPEPRKKKAAKKKAPSSGSAGTGAGVPVDYRSRVEANLASIDERLRDAEEENRTTEVGKLLALRQRALMDLARFSGELSSLDEAKLTSTARFTEVKQAIAKALAPFPDAAKAVVLALERLGAG